MENKSFCTCYGFKRWAFYFIDRRHSLRSLPLPQAALPSLPGLDLHFSALQKNKCFARSSLREQQSTGLLHLDLRISSTECHTKKKTIHEGWTRGDSFASAHGADICFARSSPREQQSPGLLHLIGSIPVYHRDQIKREAEASLFIGAGDRDRTGTLFTARDFKSLVSANSTTAAYSVILRTCGPWCRCPFAVPGECPRL